MPACNIVQLFVTITVLLQLLEQVHADGKGAEQLCAPEIHSWLDIHAGAFNDTDPVVAELIRENNREIADKGWQPPTPECSGIPRIIHHIWWQGLEHLFRKAERSAAYPAGGPESRAQHIPGWIASFRNTHRSADGWKHMMWSENMVLELARTVYGGVFWGLIASFGEMIKKIDTARYLILLAHGGVVVDTDIESLRNLEPILKHRQLIFAEEDADHHSVNCAFIASTSHHPFLYYLLHEIGSRHRYAQSRGVLETTGPAMLTVAIEKYKMALGRDESLTILKGYNASLIYPVLASELGSEHIRAEMWSCTVNRNCSAMFDEADQQPFTLHHYAASWYEEYAASQRKFEADTSDEE